MDPIESGSNSDTDPDPQRIGKALCTFGCFQTGSALDLDPDPAVFLKVDANSGFAITLRVKLFCCSSFSFFLSNKD